MQLKLCQQYFSKALLPDCSKGQFKQACGLLAGNGTITPNQSILIYRHNISGALQRVLAGIYPVCLHILGEECFDSLAKDYAWQASSDCADLDEFGADLYHFITGLLPEQPALSTLPYLPDLLQLEWAYHRAQTTADDVQSLWENLQENGDKTIRLQLSHSISLLESPYPLMEIWQQNQTESSTGDIMMPDVTQYFLVYRQLEEVKIIDIDSVTYNFLNGCRHGHSLYQLANTLGAGAEQALIQLPAMIQYGWVTGFETSTGP